MESNEQATLRIVEKSMKDPEFRKELLADPKSVIERETGKAYPAGIKVQAIETDPNVIVFPVPKLAAAAAAGAEMTERELESVAAGIGSTMICFKGTGCIICFINRY